MDIISGIFKVVSKLFCLASKINCGRKLGILIPKGFGKSTICQKLNSQNRNQILCDLESLAQMNLSQEQRENLDALNRSSQFQNIKLFLLPIWRDFLKDLMSKFKHQNVIVFSSSVEAFSYLEIKNKKVYIPSQSFFDSIIATITDEGKRKAMIASRNEMITAYASSSKVFSSFVDLEKQLSDDLGLIQKI
jgi:hypothetical protein